jgi:hypothetical protein
VAVSGHQRALLSSERIVLVAATALALVPSLLPKMHERYFFPADVIAIVLACPSTVVGTCGGDRWPDRDVSTVHLEHRR